MKVMIELDQEERKKVHTDTGPILFKPVISQITLLLRTEERLV
jgi:hypothetical protein